MTSKQKLVVIVGPTASGKSELAVRLSKKFNGEVISADSRQIYHGLDIGTAKVKGKWQNMQNAKNVNPVTTGLRPRYPSGCCADETPLPPRAYARGIRGNGMKNANVATTQRSLCSCNIFAYKNIPHHCLDFVSPKRTFTVAEYKKCATSAIKDITSRGRLPILAGGTGFWIDAVVHGLNLPPVPPNQRLRRGLEKKNPGALLKILQKLDPKRAKTVDRKNPPRLIRAIEIATALGRVPKLKRNRRYHALWLGLDPAKNILKRKIACRLKGMISAGLLEETRSLIKAGLTKKRIGELGFEYRYGLERLRGRISNRQLKEGLLRDTLEYARRQMRWFKPNPEIHWLRDKKQTEVLVQKFLNPVRSLGAKILE